MINTINRSDVSRNNVKRNKIEQYIKVFNKTQEESKKRLEELHKQSGIINDLHYESNIDLSVSSEINVKEQEILNEKNKEKEKKDNYLLDDNNIVIPNTFISIKNVLIKNENINKQERNIIGSLNNYNFDTELPNSINIKFINNNKYELEKNYLTNLLMKNIENINIYENKEYKDNTSITNQFIDFIKRNKICLITNVYKEMYVNNKPASGLGDFIRGCYFIIQFCNYLKKIFGLNIEPNFIISHKISEFLSQDTKNVMEIIKTNINSFDKVNWIKTEFNNDGTTKDLLQIDSYINDFINYIIHSSTIKNVYNKKEKMNSAFIYTISFPVHEIKLSIYDKVKIQNLLKPNQLMNNYVLNIMSKYGLISKKYNVIHIRSGDKFLFGNSNSFDLNYLDKLNNIINDKIKNWKMDQGKGKKILLIADNNSIKDYVLSQYSNIISYNLSIGHFGEGQVQDSEKIKNTLLDFYLLSMSAFIVSITAYSHGSGFSKWCAFTYGIPYLCYCI